MVAKIQWRPESVIESKKIVRKTCSDLSEDAKKNHFAALSRKLSGRNNKIESVVCPIE